MLPVRFNFKFILVWAGLGLAIGFIFIGYFYLQNPQILSLNIIYDHLLFSPALSIICGILAMLLDRSSLSIITYKAINVNQIRFRWNPNNLDYPVWYWCINPIMGILNLLLGILLISLYLTKLVLTTVLALFWMNIKDQLLNPILSFLGVPVKYSAFHRHSYQHMRPIRKFLRGERTKILICLNCGDPFSSDQKIQNLNICSERCLEQYEIRHNLR